MVPGSREQGAHTGGAGKWLNSPVGWARANVIYDKGPLPRFGTLLEALHLLVWKSRTTLRVAETRAVAQAALGGDAAADAFKEYRDQVNKAVVEQERKNLAAQMDSLKTMGHVKFRPVETPKSSHLRTVRRAP